MFNVTTQWWDSQARPTLLVNNQRQHQNFMDKKS